MRLLPDPNLAPPQAATDLAIVIRRALGRLPGNPRTGGLLEAIERRLQEGLDPNQPWELGQTLVGLVSQLSEGKGTWAKPILSLLLEYGANPMLHDMPLGRTLTYDRCPDLVDLTLAHISQRERQGRGLRDAQGGNALHYLAEIHQEIGQWQLEEDLLAVPDKVVFIDSMINARRPSDGLTPLDVLWHGPVMEWDPAVRGLCWAMTAALLDRGGDPLLPRPDGGCVAETLEALVRGGLDPTPGMEAWPRIEAMLSQNRLETHTPLASAPNTGRPRL